MNKITIVFASVNLVLLIGARAINYYSNQTNIMDLLFSTAIGAIVNSDKQ